MSKEVSKTGGAGWSIEQTIEQEGVSNNKPLPKQESPILAKEVPVEPQLVYTPPERVCIFTGEKATRQRFLNGKTIWLTEEAYEGHTTGEIVEQLNKVEAQWLENQKKPKAKPKKAKSAK